MKCLRSKKEKRALLFSSSVGRVGRAQLGKGHSTSSQKKRLLASSCATLFNSLLPKNWRRVGHGAPWPWKISRRLWKTPARSSRNKSRGFTRGVEGKKIGAPGNFCKSTASPSVTKALRTHACCLSCRDADPSLSSSSLSLSFPLSPLSLLFLFFSLFFLSLFRGGGSDS
jgi:hypothetical protein